MTTTRPTWHDWALGDAKIFRNPGGRITPQALEALVLGVHLLKVNRILIVLHTKCAMASSTEAQIHESVSFGWPRMRLGKCFSVIDDQRAALVNDVRIVITHPLIPDSTVVGRFIYDVDTGLLEQTA
ncbi:MAG: carbonic anhydrase [Marmoricola sp.]